MIPSASRKCKSICNCPYYFQHFEWPIVSGWHLGTTPKLQGTLLCPHSVVNMIPNTELPVHPMLICIDFLSVMCCFQILLDLYNLLLHLLEQFWSKHHSVHRVVPSHWCLTPSAIQSFIQTHPQGCLLSIVISKLCWRHLPSYTLFWSNWPS